jgi:hypothetical protein
MILKGAVVAHTKGKGAKRRAVKLKAAHLELLLGAV